LPNINSYQPSSGQKIKDNGQVVNTAEMIESIYKALVVNKDAGMQLNGSILGEDIGGNLTKLRIQSLAGSDDWLNTYLYNALVVNSTGLAYNGNNKWDRVRNNTEGTLLTSASRTANTNSPKQTNYNAKAVVIFLDVTTASGVGGLTPFLRLYDPVSGKTTAISTGSLITTTGTFAFIIGLGATGAITTSVKAFVSAIVSRQYDVQIYHNDNSAYTYSVGQCLVV
jgi:hypothetical protein